MNTFNKIPTTLFNLCCPFVSQMEKNELPTIVKKQILDQVFSCNYFEFYLIATTETIIDDDLNCEPWLNTAGALILSEFEPIYFKLLHKIIFNYNHHVRIPISIHFYSQLLSSGVISKMLMTKNANQMAQLLLILSGDVEENPGPVDYKTSCTFKWNKNKVSKARSQTKLELSYERDMRKYSQEEDQEPKKVKANMQIFGMLSGVTSTITGLKSMKLMDNIDGLLPTIEETLKTFQQGITNVSSKICKGIDVIALVGDIMFALLNIYIAKQGHKIAALSIELCRILLRYGISHIDAFRQYTYQYFSSTPIVKSEMQIDFEALPKEVFEPTHIVIFLMGVLSLVFTQALPRPTFTESLLKRLGDLGRSAKGVKDLGTVTHEMISIALDKFKTEILGQRPQQEIETFISGIDIWFDDVRSFLERRDEFKKSDDILRKPEIIIEVENLYKRGMEFSKEISDKKLNQRFTLPFNIHMKYLTDLLKQVDTSGAFGTRPRTQPVVIWLYGESGVGKSGMSWPLAVDLNNMFVPNAAEAKEFSKNIYMRNVEQEFWDNYQGQNVVIYDDFGQIKDSSSNPNTEFMELIRTANIAPYPLHMAHLEDKRKARFTSKIVLLTSNVFEHVVSSLTFPDAFRRRIDLCARVYNKDEYTKAGYSKQTGEAVQRLDKNKVMAKTGKIVSTDVYLLDIVDPESGIVLEEGIEYSEFLSMAQEKTRQAFHSSRQMNDFLEQYAEERFVTAQMQVDFDNSLVELSEDDILKLNEQGKIVDMAGDRVDVLEKSIEHGLNFDGGDFEIYMSLFWNRVKNDLRSKNDRVVSQLQAFRNSAMNYLSEWKNSIVETIKAHPFTTLTSILLIISGIFVISKLYSKLFGKTRDSLTVKQFAVQNVIVKPKEEGLEYNDVTQVPHDKIIQFLPNITQNRYPLLVNKPSATLLSALNLVGEEFTIYSASNSFNYNNRTINLEASTSGDPITLKPKVIKTEASVSGDPVTVKPKVVKTEAGASGDPITIKAKVVKTEASVSGDPITLKPKTCKMEMGTVDANMQMWKDQVAQNIISNRIFQNMYKISVKTTKGWKQLLNGLFIRSTNMLVPGHLLGFVQEGETIQIRNAFNVEFEMPWKDVIKTPITTRDGENKEAALLTFPKYVNQHTDLVKHFSNSDSMSMYRTADTCVPVLRYSQAMERLMFTILGNQQARALDTPVYIDDDEKGLYMLRQGLTYKCPTRAGDCGAPVIINETQVLRKIAGIHVAGDTDGVAYAESITQPDLERALQRIPANMQIQTDYDCYLPLKSKPLPDGEIDVFEIWSELPCERFIPIGKVSPLFEPSKTELRPSLLYGQITDIKTKPAFLRHPQVNIKHKNLAKSALNVPYIEPEILDRAYLQVKNKWFNGRDPKLARLLTWEECIKGSSDSQYLGPLNRQSSPGFPWILSREKGFKGKTGWFGNDEYEISEEVISACIHRENQAREGIRTPTIWVDTLKDERRPIEKVNALKTRVFSNGPMDYTILFRKYFLGFIAHLMENRITNEVSIGTNVYSQDWKKTALKLKQKGKKVIAGDFSTFDGTLNSCMMERFVHLVNEFYDDGEENALIRQTLFLDVFNSVHLCDGLIYMTTHSQPSGNPATTPLNCFINSMGLRMCFEECVRGKSKLSPLYEKWSMRDFEEHVSMVSYGDDNVINFSDAVAPYFNMDTITEAFAKFGYVYTDEAKTIGGCIPKWRQLEDVAYLKRSFRYDDKRKVWEAPLTLDTILETPNWCRGGLDIETGTKVNSEVSIMELSLHNEETFNFWSKKIANAFLMTTGQCLEYDTYLGYARKRYEEYYL